MRGADQLRDLSRVDDQTLILRHYAPIKRWIKDWGGSLCLSIEDIEDAQHEMVLVLMEAIARFRRRDATDPDGWDFPTFLEWLVRNRFYNFLKQLRRLQRRFDNAPKALAAIRFGASARAGQGASEDEANCDPLLAASRNETLACLGKVVSRLGETEQELWEKLVREHGLAAIAAELKIAYVTAKRRRRKLLAKVQLEMSSSFEER
jgi:RNA polymerase sigma factor (sigma-70 family)